MIEIRLSWYELAMAASVGVRRHIEALRENLEDRHGARAVDHGWNYHIEGACGEMAYARARNRYWSGSVNTFQHGGDVGAVQVRTRSRHEWDLIVRSNAEDDHVYVHVTGAAPIYRVHGWIRAGDAKRPEWWHDHGGHGPAWFVPEHALARFPTGKAVAA